MKKLFVYILLLFAGILQAGACTTAVISGKFTADGRPLLFKQRDTHDPNNKFQSFSDGRYPYIAVVSTRDSGKKGVFGGHNSAGFAIINSASYNLNPGLDGDEKGLDAYIMKLALQTCASLADFEHLLDSLPRPIRASSNFGVIDAHGGAAYYETSDKSYVKYDANDLAVAPFGYIIRTNFSFSGDRKRDKGLARFEVASELFYQASLKKSISFEFILKDVSRSLKHGLTGVDLYNNIPSDGSKAVLVPFRDFIPRYLTTSVLVFQGVKDNEPASQTVLWSVVGCPLTSVAVPLLVNSKGYLPKIVTSEGEASAPLFDWSSKLKQKLFPIDRGEGEDYLNLAALISTDQKGILQTLQPAENKVIAESQKYINKWRTEGIKVDELKKLDDWIDQYLTDYYKSNYSL